MNEQNKEQQSILSEIIETDTTSTQETPTPKFKDVGKVLTDRVKGLIFWTGLISSVISAVAYLLIVIVMVVGFESETTLSANIAFALITAFIGVLISQLLKIQGINFAKSEEQVKNVWERFYGRKTKERKYHSLKFFWLKSMVFDICIKAVSIGIICVGTVYIFIAASGDIMRIFMALFNLTLFAGFGMMSLTKAYDFTREQHVAWMEHKMAAESEVDKESKRDE